MKQFEREVAERIEANGNDEAQQAAAQQFMATSIAAKYSYNFSWLGRPIIQYPQDIVAMQELIWSLQPELIVETGIAHGGSLIFSASMLELNAACGGPADAGVLGIDIDIRPHNREAIEQHPMARRITMIQASSTAPEVLRQAAARAAGKKNVLVCLDSNHTHDHVLQELEGYAPLVTVGSYCVVFDTIVEDLPAEVFTDRPWGPGDNPKTAVHKFLQTHGEFAIDAAMDSKLMITVAPDGFLKRVR
jgi:cephalosporin hydroxylase